MNESISAQFAAVLKGKNKRVIQLKHPCVTFLAQNFDGRAALIANLSLHPDQVVPDGRGFTVTTGRGGAGDYVRIASAELGVSLLFLKLVEYILERTAQLETGLDARSLLITAIDEFRRFSQRRPGRLTEEEIRGLFAELLMLLHLQSGQDIWTRDAFASWGGPFGALHDFQFASGKAIEVKSTHRPPTEVRVSPPAQMAPTADGLELIVLPLERVAKDLDTSVRFVDVVRQVGALASSHGGDVLDLWEAAQKAIGLDVADEYYGQWRFLVGDWLRFVVDDTFPQIPQTAIPDGMVKIAYSLRLDSLGPFSASFDELEVFI